MAAIPETLYARNGSAHIAYQVVGSGPPDLLLVDTWVHHVEVVWDVPDLARFLRRLSSFARLIHFDRRGTGLSDPVPLDALPDIDTQVQDAIAVLDAARAERPAVLGLNDGTLIAMVLAATHPDRCASLVLWAATVKHEMAAGQPMEQIDQVIKLIEENAATGTSGVEWLAPSRANDQAFTDQLARLQRLSVRPGAFGHYYRQSMESDAHDVPDRITAPTLILNRTHNPIVAIDQSRDLASSIANARMVELPGIDHLPYAQDGDAVVEEIEEFVTGTRSGTDPDRILATLLFTDIVDSTKRAAELGDRKWRDVLDRHHEVVRAELERFGGREVVTTGDGFFAAFDTPARTIRCAHAIVDAAASHGLAIRAGVHMGEVEVRGNDLGGLAVHIAARIAALAPASGVLVSSTVKDVLVGTGSEFEDRGEHELKGVPGTWRLFASGGP